MESRELFTHISIDVSTGEHDYANRAYAKMPPIEIMDIHGDGSERVALFIGEVNFDIATTESAARIAALEEENAKLRERVQETEAALEGVRLSGFIGYDGVPPHRIAAMALASKDGNACITTANSPVMRLSPEMEMAQHMMRNIRVKCDAPPAWIDLEDCLKAANAILADKFLSYRFLTTSGSQKEGV